MTQHRIATAADDKTLQQLLRDNAMPSWVSITTRREPSYFSGAELMGESYTLLTEATSGTVGMHACSYLPVHIDGKPETIGYLGAMRVAQPFRHRIRFIKSGFRALRTHLPQQASVPFYFTSIAAENVPARRLLEADLPGMPRYTPAGEMHTLVFSSALAQIPRHLEQATPADIPEIVDFYNAHAAQFQFSPRLTREWMESLDGTIGLLVGDFYLHRDKDGRIMGCLALWDQRHFKQSVIESYRAPLRQLRPLYNLYARMSNRVELPPCGRALDYLFIAFFACSDAHLVPLLLKEAAYLSRERSARSCVLGLSPHHPFLPRLKRMLKPSVYVTVIETVVLAGETHDPALEAYPVQPEVALL